MERECTKPHHHAGKSSESLLEKNLILTALGVEPGQTVLDAGCGNGYMAKAFSQQVGETGTVYALDPDEASIAALGEETEGTNIVPMLADITRPTDLPASAFDLIYLSMVVHGFSPEQFGGFEAEVTRLLAPDGRLAIVEIAKREMPFGPPLERRLSPEQLRDTLALEPVTLVELGEWCYMQVFRNPPQASGE